MRKFGERISTAKVKIAERVAEQANPEIRFEAIPLATSPTRRSPSV
ncbi:MAG TPA: hypothetical protein VFC29_06620 [Candidatus Limnocylindrales bacterium]|nr:hypothetical protein [Candidatus Limnocylindrales bacterium]